MATEEEEILANIVGEEEDGEIILEAVISTTQTPTNIPLQSTTLIFLRWHSRDTQINIRVVLPVTINPRDMARNILHSFLNILHPTNTTSRLSITNSPVRKLTLLSLLMTQATLRIEIHTSHIVATTRCNLLSLRRFHNTLTLRRKLRNLHLTSLLLQPSRLRIALVHHIKAQSNRN